MAPAVGGAWGRLLYCISMFLVSNHSRRPLGGISRDLGLRRHRTAQAANSANYCWPSLVAVCCMADMGLQVCLLHTLPAPCPLSRLAVDGPWPLFSPWPVLSPSLFFSPTQSPHLQIRPLRYGVKSQTRLLRWRVRWRKKVSGWWNDRFKRAVSTRSLGRTDDSNNDVALNPSRQLLIIQVHRQQCSFSVQVRFNPFFKHERAYLVVFQHYQQHSWSRSASAPSNQSQRISRRLECLQPSSSAPGRP
jgi:hypothetical protein